MNQISLTVGILKENFISTYIAGILFFKTYNNNFHWGETITDE